MTAGQRLVKAEKILAVAGGEILRSCALQAMWARCNNRTVLDAITGTKAAFGFNSVRDALHRDLVVTLLTVLEKRQDHFEKMRDGWLDLADAFWERVAPPVE